MQNPIISSLSTFILIDLFNPEAKNPPKGPIKLAIKPIIAIWKVSFDASKGRNPKFVFSRRGSWHTGRLKGIRLGSTIGQVNPGISSRAAVSIKVKKKVEIAPPMYPSQVFLGDNAIRGLFPKK